MSAAETEARGALDTLSDMVEELWGGLVLLVEDEGQNDDVRKAQLRGLLRTASSARGMAEVALGNARS